MQGRPEALCVSLELMHQSAEEGGVQVTASDYTGAKEIVAVQRRTLEDTSETSFEFRKQRFCWNEELGHFEKLKFPTQASPALCPGHSATVPVRT